MSSPECGARLAALVYAHPGVIGELRQEYHPALGETGSLRELLPLPSPAFSPLTGLDFIRLFPPGKELSEEAISVGSHSWLYVVIAALNVMDSNGRQPSAPPRKPNGVQREACQRLYDMCQAFCADRAARTPVDWHKELGSKAFSYWGEPVFTAEPLTLVQVTASLPPKGVAAVVDICRVICGQVLDQLRDPESLILPKSEWPPTTPKAKTQLENPSEWGDLANLLWTRGLVDWIPEAAVFSPYGQPVVNGLFAVPKDKPVPGAEHLHTQRLICNLVPSNFFFRTIRGDVDDLPYILQWGTIVLHDDEHLTICQEVMSCALYLYRMPPCWLPYFAVGIRLRLNDFQGN